MRLTDIPSEKMATAMLRYEDIRREMNEKAELSMDYDYRRALYEKGKDKRDKILFTMTWQDTLANLRYVLNRVPYECDEVYVGPRGHK